MNTLKLIGSLAVCCVIQFVCGFQNPARADDLSLISAPEDPYLLGTQADLGGVSCKLSADGRYAVFQSAATNLIASDHNGLNDVFLKDRVSGAIEPISRRSDGRESRDSSGGASISGDGRYVAFYSSDDLTGVGATTRQVYYADRESGAIKLVSHTIVGAPGNGTAYSPSIDQGGAFIAFDSDSDDLVASDSNGVSDIFRFEMATGAIVLVSTRSSGTQGNGRSTGARIAAGGTVIAFTSEATNLDGVDANGDRDVFVKDLSAGITQRVSISTSGGDADRESTLTDISVDGSTVVFHSSATNLVANDGNGITDVFVRKLATGTTRRVSEPAAGEADAASYGGVVGTTGRYIAFLSLANNLAGPNPNGFYQIYLRDMQTGALTRLTDTASSIGSQTSLSADLSTLCFDATADDLVTGDSNNVQDVFALDITTLAITRANLAETAHPITVGDGISYLPDISNDGMRIVFRSSASLLDAEAYTSDNASSDVFLHDVATASMTRLSNTPTGDGGNGDSYDPQISGDGRFVAFESLANDMVPGIVDGNVAADIFRVDTESGAIVLVSESGFGGSTSSERAEDPSISGDGSRVVFASASADLVPGDVNGRSDVFVWGVAAGTTRVSVSSSGQESNNSSYSPRISGNGNFVTFNSVASNLVANDTNLTADIFVHEIDSGLTERVSVAVTGEEANGYSFFPAISRNGRYVAFQSEATNLVPNDLSPGTEVVLVDRVTGVVRLATADLTAMGFVEVSNNALWISPDGSIVLFEATTQDGIGALLRYRANTDVLEIVQMGVFYSGPLGYAASADGLTTVYGWGESLVPADNNDPRSGSDIYLLREDAPVTDTIFANGFEVLR